MSYFLRSRSGFSLIELVVVLGIIGVLGLSVSSYIQDSLEEARYVTVQQNAKMVQGAISRYFKENLTYPTSLESLQGRYLQQSVKELLVNVDEGNLKVLVQVSNTGNPNVYQVSESERRWIEYAFGGNAHGGRQIANIKVVDINTPAPPISPPPATYTLTLAGAGISSLPVPGAYPSNTAITVTVSPPANQHVSSLIVNGINRKSDLSGNDYSFYLTSDTNVSVTYEPIPVLLTLTGGQMTSSPSAGAVPINTSVTVNINPLAGQTIETFAVNGINQTGSLVGNSYNFTITEDTIVTVTYNGIPTSTNATLALSGDRITSSPAAGSLPLNTSVTVTVNPKIWQEINTFTVGGVDRKANLVSNAYTFNINADTVVAVTYVSAPAYAGAVEYDPANSPWDTDDLVIYNGNLYKANWYTTSLPGSDNTWTEITDEWRSSNIYNGGEIVWHNGAQFEARGYSLGQEPGLIASPWQEINTDQWRNFNIYDTGDEVWHNSIHYRANWYNQNTEPPAACWTVIP